jgi:hypothetical protein
VRAETDRSERRRVKWGRVHPLVLATALVVVAASAGILIALTLEGKPKEALQVASITLVYGALLGGVVKLLLDDFQRRREQRADQARFVTKVLADLKASYDRVERVRVLVPAHRSALTYGNEMRDLIDAQVQLRNVVRALDQTSPIKDDRAEQIRRSVKAMETYLRGLTAEFQVDYKRSSDAQSEYEARKKKALEAGEPLDEVTNEAWTQIASLKGLQGFIGVWKGDNLPSEEEGEPGKPAERLPYELEFEEPLDAASWLLRDELRVLDGNERGEMPERHRQTLDRLPPDADEEDAAVKAELADSGSS